MELGVPRGDHGVGRRRVHRREQPGRLGDAEPVPGGVVPYGCLDLRDQVATEEEGGLGLPRAPARAGLRTHDLQLLDVLGVCGRGEGGWCAGAELPRGDEQERAEPGEPGVDEGLERGRGGPPDPRCRGRGEGNVREPAVPFPEFDDAGGGALPVVDAPVSGPTGRERGERVRVGGVEPLLERGEVGEQHVVGRGGGGSRGGCPGRTAPVPFVQVVAAFDPHHGVVHGDGDEPLPDRDLPGGAWTEAGRDRVGGDGVPLADHGRGIRRGPGVRVGGRCGGGERHKSDGRDGADRRPDRRTRGDGERGLLRHSVLPGVGNPRPNSGPLCEQDNSPPNADEPPPPAGKGGSWGHTAAVPRSRQCV